MSIVRGLNVQWRCMYGSEYILCRILAMYLLVIFYSSFFIDILQFSGAHFLCSKSSPLPQVYCMYTSCIGYLGTPQDSPWQSWTYLIEY